MYISFAHLQYNEHVNFNFLHPQRLVLQAVIKLHNVNFSSLCRIVSLVIRIGFSIPVSVSSHPNTDASGRINSLGQLAFFYIKDW